MDASQNVVPTIRAKKVKKSELIRLNKVKGAAHLNHKGVFVPEKQIGEDCK